MKRCVISAEGHGVMFSKESLLPSKADFVFRRLQPWCHQAVACKAGRAKAGKGSIGTEEQYQQTLTAIRKFWDPEQNNGKDPSQYPRSSTQLVSLQCGGCPDCGRVHVWTPQFKNVTSRAFLRCPSCYSFGGYFCECRSVAADLRLAPEWHESNGPANSVALATKKKYLWTCPVCEHEYSASPATRSGIQTGCPLCARKRTFKGLLKTKRPELAAEFQQKANTRLLESLTCGSKYRATWECQQCHKTFQMTVYERTRYGRGCPNCKAANKLGDRLAPQAISSVSPSISSQPLPQVSPRTKASQMTEPKEQIMLPSTRSQSSAETEAKKTALAPGMGKDINRSGSIVGKTAGNTIDSSGMPTSEPHVKLATEETAESTPAQLAYAERLPDIEKLWDVKRNGGKKPKDFSLGSEKKVCLKCDGCGKCGRKHEWDTQFRNLVRQKTVQCPICISAGRHFCECRSIAAHGRLALEWHRDNPPPESVAWGARKKYLWTCPDCEEQYMASPTNRSGQNSGCPECAKAKKALGREYRLGLMKDELPELAAEYDTGKNETAMETLTCGARLNAWWTCRECKRQFRATMQARARKGKGCPTCNHERRWGQDSD